MWGSARRRSVDTAVFSTTRKQKFSRNFVGVGALDDPQSRIFRKQIEQQPNDVRTELCGCSLWLEISTVSFRSRAELAERSKLRAAGGIR